MIPQRPLDWTATLGEPVAELSWSPDGQWLAVGGVEGRVVVYEAATGKPVRDWQAHEGGLFRCAFAPSTGLLATSGQDGHVRLWNAASGEADQALPLGAAWVEHLAWSSDGQWLAATAGRNLRLWQPSTGLVHEAPPAKTTWSGLAWHHSRPEIAVARFGGVDIWSATTARCTTSLPWKTSLISVAWSPDGRWIVAGTQELSVQIWQLPFRPESELAMSGYAAKVRQLAWHPSSRYLATGGGIEIMVWDCAGKGPEGTSPRILTGHLGKVTALAYQKAGHLLASGGEDGRVLLWNAGKSSDALRQYQLGASITAVAWDARDTRLAIGTHTGEVALGKSVTG